jgi:ribosome-binding factor A
VKPERSQGHRIEQLQSTLRRAIQDVLAKGLNDPRYRGMVSVTELRLTRDLREATVFISIYPEKHQDLTMHAIVHAGRHIRREAGDLVALDRLPELHFKLDTRLKAEAELLGALSKAKETARPQPEDAGEGESAELDAAPPTPKSPPKEQPKPRPKQGTSGSSKRAPAPKRRPRSDS